MACSPCGVQHATAACSGGACSVRLCDAGYADCNASAGDGCETQLTNDAMNCGACNHACQPAETCQDGVCMSGPCAVPNTNCGSVCANLLTSPQHCGGCGVACAPQPGAVATCANGSCIYTQGCGDLTACEQGCVDTTTDPDNCGGCGTKCSDSLGMRQRCEDGVCQCPAGQTKCLDPIFQAARCVDSTRSTLDCGGCDQPCSEACSGGACVTLSSLYIASNVAVSDMTADETHVYWVDKLGGTVNRIPVAGGPVEVVASGQAWPLRLALDDTTVYWTANLGGAVMSAPKAGGAPSVVAATAEPTSLLVDDVSVYWIDALDEIIYRTTKSGGVPEEVFVAPSGPLHPMALLELWQTSGAIYAADHTDVLGSLGVSKSTLGPLPADLYVTTWSGDLRASLAIDDDAQYALPNSLPVLSLPLSGGVARKIDPSIDVSSPILVSGGWLYYRHVLDRFNNPNARALVRIGTCADARSIEIVVDPGPAALNQLAANSTTLFWTDGANIGAHAL